MITVPTPPGKSWNFHSKISSTCKILEKFYISSGKSWNLLCSDADGSFWLQIDMFQQTNVAIIVATRYVFRAAGMPKCFCVGAPPRTLLRGRVVTAFYQMPLWLYLNILACHRVLENTSGSWKILEKSRKFVQLWKWEPWMIHVVLKYRVGSLLKAFYCDFLRFTCEIYMPVVNSSNILERKKVQWFKVRSKTD